MILIKDFKLLINSPEDLCGKQLNLVCWIYCIRVHKNITFLTLRNNGILLQGILRDLTYLEDIKKESYVKLIGSLNLRDSRNINNEQQLGNVEFEIQSLQLINKSNDLPFEINKAHLLTSDIKYSYRYLSFRNNEIRNNIYTRCNLIRQIREIMWQNDFIEMNTPIITAPSISGASDYLVLSTQQPGLIYALPQSPQIYKQLIICGDICRYYQIAPCFRNEAARQNRLSGDFYQLDIEMAHVTSIEEIIEITDKVMLQVINSFKKEVTIDIRKYTYTQALEIYGYDKVDIRVIKEYNFTCQDNIVEFDYHEFLYKKVIVLTKNVDLHDKRMRVVITQNIIDEFYSILSNSIDNSKIDYISYCWITHFPMYKYDALGNFKFGHNPFSKPIDVNDNIFNIKALQYDLVINGQEIGGGSLRNTDIHSFIKMFTNIGYDEKKIVEHFKYFINAMQLGMPEHGGIALGIERICCILSDNNNIRDFVPFPTQQNGIDIMLNFPVSISNNILTNYGFMNLKKNES